MDITIAYSAVLSVGMTISATEGVCGSVDGRGILFDRVPPVEKMLVSFLVGEPMLPVDRVMLDSAPLTGRLE
jgi:hypothetical protein